MDVCAIFNLNSLFQISHESPKLALDILFCDWSVAIEFGIKWHFVLEVSAFEVVCLLLERPQGVETAFLKSELTVADQAAWAVPLRIRLLGKRGIKARAMINVIARLAHGQETCVLPFSTCLTLLSRCNGFVTRNAGYRWPENRHVRSCDSWDR